MPEQLQLAERGGQGAAVGDGDSAHVVVFIAAGPCARTGEGHDVPCAVVLDVTASLVTVPGRAAHLAIRTAFTTSSACRACTVACQIS